VSLFALDFLHLGFTLLLHSALANQKSHGILRLFWVFQKMIINPLIDDIYGS
jgi:hypothetical protein